MRYRLLYTNRAIKDIRKLEQKIKKKIGETLLRHEEDPLNHAKRLIGSNIGSYRFRIGDYRVIFDLEDDDIVILRVGHRRDIYRG